MYINVFHMFILGFFNVCVLKRKFFEIVYDIQKLLFSFNFLLNCHSYILQKMFNLDDISNENNKDHNLKWSYVPYHPYIMLIIGRFWIRKNKYIA